MSFGFEVLFTFLGLCCSPLWFSTKAGVSAVIKSRIINYLHVLFTSSNICGWGVVVCLHFGMLYIFLPAVSVCISTGCGWWIIGDTCTCVFWPRGLQPQPFKIWWHCT